MYGNLDDFKAELAGVDVDRLATGGVLDKILDDELDRATLRIEAYCNRRSGGFNSNVDTTFTLDGTGISTLRLSESKYVPIISVSDVSIDSSSQTLTNFTTYDEHIEFKRRGDTIDSTSVYASFLPGTKNISITLTWGYATTPPAVVAAEYLFAKERMLSKIATAVDSTNTAVPPGVDRWQTADYMVQFGKRGQYGAQMEDCVRMAHEYLRAYCLVIMTGPRGRRTYRGTGTSESEMAKYGAGS